MINFFKKKRVEKNLDIVKKLRPKKLAKFLADNTYSYFRFDVTKSKFEEDLLKWLYSDASINSFSNKEKTRFIEHQKIKGS